MTAFDPEIAIQYSLAAFVSCDGDGTVSAWNAAAEVLFGWSAAEVIGRPLAQVIIPEQLRAADPLSLARIGGDGTPAVLGQRLALAARTKDRGQIVVELMIGPGRAAPGAGPGGFSLFINDVTARQDAQSRLREAEQRFRKAFDEASIGMALVSLDGYWLRVNDAVCRLLGYSAEDLLTRTFQDITHPDDLDLDLEFVRQMLAGEIRTYDMEKRYFRRDGTTVWTLLSVSLVRDEDGAPLYFISQIQDIDERKRMRMMFRGLVDSAPDAVVTVDESGKIVLVNAAVERMLGYERSELIGKPVDALLPEQLRAKHARHRAHFVLNPAVRRMATDLDLTVRRKDGVEIPVDINLSPLDTDDGRLTIASVRDVSERVDLVRNLRQLNEDLEEASRAKDEFLAGMSHELRTPLNIVLGFAGTLLMELPGPLSADQREQLAIIESNGKHLLSLINDLLDLAKLQSGKYTLSPEEVDCIAVLDEVVSSLRPLAERKHLILNYTAPGATSLFTDRRALAQILLNLTANAIKFTEHGRVHLEISRELSADGAIVRLRVSDTGPGIAPDDLSRIFSRFEQVTRSGRHVHEGTGLGLHISRRLADLMGARLQVNSEVGFGSTFTLDVPDTTVGHVAVTGRG